MTDTKFLGPPVNEPKPPLLAPPPPLPEPRVNEWSARGLVLAPVDGRLHDPELLDTFLRRVRIEFPGEKIYVTEYGELRVTTYRAEGNVGPHLDWRD